MAHKMGEKMGKIKIEKPQHIVRDDFTGTISRGLLFLVIQRGKTYSIPVIARVYARGYFFS